MNHIPWNKSDIFHINLLLQSNVSYVLTHFFPASSFNPLGCKCAGKNWSLLTGLCLPNKFKTCFEHLISVSFLCPVCKMGSLVTFL